MNDPRKHHYVPVFYLRQWTTNGFLCEMRKIRGKIIVSSKAPDGTGFQKDLYKIEGIPTDVAQHFERTFMHMVDTQAAVAMRKVLAGTTETWPIKERDAWVRFILSLIFRNPEAVTVVKEEMRRIWDESIQAVRDDYDSYRQPGDPDTAEEYIARTDPNAPAIAASNFLQRMMNSGPIANGILKLRWGRINFPHSRWTLVTSDRPLDLPHGLGSKDSYIALPVGPRTLFVGTSDRLDLRDLSAARQNEMVRDINERTVSMARQYVWAIDDSAREFVRKYIGTLPERQLISDRARQLAIQQARGANE
ncbi:DUF4238 domain-containing protein [Bradyrhizobium zhanjiangense]|uniref:DUF4238 domain-containing protein n=1 Tax=Bradyrhizobium zhanjiangense TaxID=1325107 RepID=A0ABY0DCI3_9BRAD|nr:DUF4238 domain-containing protein [Bradyrhizobium zhanjiangense]RXG88418.1 DUF4238 domain-containing protein [Bradyrhizobium zhanjiangense]